MQKKKSLYAKFLGFLTKKGKKIKAKNLLSKAFENLSLKLHKPSFFLLTLIFLKLNCFVEVKKISNRRATHFVPFMANSRRRIYLIMKWLVRSVLEDKRRISFDEKLTYEMSNVINSKTAKSVGLKEKNILQALQNRSNSHFRW